MHKTIFKSLFKQYIFWLLFFAAGRLIFLIYHFQKLEGIPSDEVLTVFIKAIPLDTSVACYLLALSWIFLTVRVFYPTEIISKVILILVAVECILVSFILSAELEIYEEWGTKLSAKIFSYFTHPTEIYNSISTGLFFFLFILALINSGAGFLIYKRYFASPVEVSKKNALLFISLFILIPGLLLLGIRGGFRQVPINQSSAYFSRHDVLNAAAVNPSWNLLHSYIQNKKIMNKNLFVEMPFSEAEKIVDSLNVPEKDSTLYLLSSQKPNVVLILLESFSADLLHTLGGYEETAPELDKISEDGFYFSQCYATGNRSDQGVAAVMSGFPAQPLTSILSQPAKFQKLPSLVTSFSEAGYFTSYFFGGQLTYENIKAYLISKGIDKMVELDDYSSDLPHGKLGVHDEFLFNRMLDESESLKTPFFSTIFTLSTHPPFDFPGEKKTFPWAGDENNYVNASMYSDSCVGDFIRKAKSKNWFSNTLFVFIADHSRESPRKNNYYSSAYRHIPFILYGDVLKPEFRGKKYDRIVSQIDLASTLLSQLKIDSKSYRWSKNLMNPAVNEFAFYAYLDGSEGWIQKMNNFTYNKNLATFYEENFSDSVSRKDIIRCEKAYLQVLFQSYLNY